MSSYVKNAAFLAAGIVIGYFVADHRVSQRYADRAEHEILEANRFYQNLYSNVAKTEEPKDSLEKAAGALADYKGISHGPSVLEQEKAVAAKKAAARKTTAKKTTTSTAKKVPTQSQEEVALPFHKPPYIITAQQFVDVPDNWDQVTCTWFREDATLVDEDDDPYPPSRVDRIVGLENLTKFGANENEKNILYIRNEEYSQDFEVELDERAFAEVSEALGLGDKSP